MSEEPTISASGERLYQRLLPIMQQDAEFGWFGRFLCGAIADGMLQGLDDIVLGSEIDGVLYGPWCTVFDPNVCPGPWLPWCASVYGAFSPGVSPEEQRTRLIELPQQKRGSVEAMEAAAKLTLTGSKTIEIIERPDGMAYQILATTMLSETPDEEATLNALLSQKAAGLKLIYTCTEFWLVAELELFEEGKDFLEFEAAFASVHTLEIHGVI